MTPPNARAVREPADVDVAIVGAGATGSYLAARLASLGASVVVLERRLDPPTHTRAIGLHPPGLEALARVGAADPLVATGIPVRRGHGGAGAPGRDLRRLGTIAFGAHLPDPWPFVLTAPQHVTEGVLLDRLEALAPGAVRRGVTVRGRREDAAGVTLEASDARGGGTLEVRARDVIACTGARGGAERWVAGRRAGRSFDDAYLMIDLPQAAEAWPAALGPLAADEAWIHLAPAGVVEAFPLPGGVRRWVVRTPVPAEADPVHLARLVAGRMGVVLDPGAATMRSSFGVEARRATPMARGRTWLAGDAAHVVPPLGGQGMTLGWLGADELVDAWRAHREGRATRADAMRTYARRQGARARRARLRAEANLRLGRPTRAAGVRDAALAAALRGPSAALLARAFTMRNLVGGPRSV